MGLRSKSYALTVAPKTATVLRSRAKDVGGGAQGGLEKKRCDLCLGSGRRKCYGCHVGEGWVAQNFSTSVCERAVWT
jgi:hypothetical protein